MQKSTFQSQIENKEEHSLSPIKAVIFDFIGTLTNIKDYTIEESKAKLCRAITDVGFNVDAIEFLNAYDQAHEKYRKIRYEQLIEVTNAVWISEALNGLGFETVSSDPRIKTALNLFFEEYLGTFKLRPCANRLLNMLRSRYKLGLISNFTYAPVIYSALRRLDINRCFDVVSVSEAVNWRKPHLKIFEETLQKLGAKAGETLYIGDSPLEDIKGAKTLGMKTVFVPSQFYSLEFLHESQQKPDCIVKDLCELYKKFPEIIRKFAV